MSYNDLLDKEGIKSNYLAVIKPSARVEGWTLISGTRYKKSFTFGPVVDVKSNGSTLTEVSTPVVTPNEWYYDATAKELYVNIGVVITTYFIIATFEIYLATDNAHWYREPLNISSNIVFFEPTINTEPSFKAMMSEILFGFMPTQTSSINISNAEQLYNEMLHASTFKNNTIDVFHWLDNLEIANLKQIISGVMGDVSQRGQALSISVLDRIDEFDTEYRNPNVSFYTSTIPTIEVEPSKIGRPIPNVFGMVDGLVLTNTDFQENEPTTSDNRTWGVRAQGSEFSKASTTVPVSPASTNTRTYLTSVSGFNVGDFAKLDKTTDEYRKVTVVGANYIEHAALVSGAAASGDTVSRETVAAVYIQQDGVTYEVFQDNYSESNVNNVLTITFTAGMEAAIPGLNTLSAFENVYARCYGKQNNVTLGGSPFGSDNTQYGNLTNPIVIIFDLLVNYLGIPESEIDTATFTTLEATIDEPVGFSVPVDTLQDFPKFKDILINIMRSTLLRLYLDFDGKWTISQMGPQGSETKTIADDEILNNTFTYDFKYRDILSDITVSYRNNNALGTLLNINKHSDNAEYLHKVSKTKTFEVYLLNDSDADTLADRLSFIFGERRGIAKLKTKNRFFDSEISDIIKISRTKLAGFIYDEDTLRERKLTTTEISKSLQSVDLVFDDQKGIEDNSSSW